MAVRGSVFSQKLKELCLSQFGQVQNNDIWLLLACQTKKAILELEHAKMTGRIGDARTELAARVEQLRDVPGLYAAELQAIDDAYRTLQRLEGEEERYAAEEQRRAIEAALHQPHSIAPKIQKLK